MIHRVLPKLPLVVVKNSSHAAVLFCLTVFCSSTAYSQVRIVLDDSMQKSAKERELISEVIDSDLKLELEQNHSKLLRTRSPVSRTSITDSEVIEVTQFDPSNLEIIALKEGTTDLTLWFGEDNNSSNILRYRVQVSKSTDAVQRRQNEYKELEEKLNEFFPNSSVELVLVAQSLIVRGQARDSEDAANILALIRRQVGGSTNSVISGNRQTAQAADNLVGNSNNGGGFGRVINMLRVPGEQQVLLKVRVAELTRTALRELGVDMSVTKKGGSFSSSFGNAGNLVSLLDGNDVSLIMKAVSSNGYSKVLAEPNLVTLSGRSASFIAGGQFAVPTAVGLGGVQAASTSFQGFGTQLQFTPTVIDKDRVRLQVAPTFSSLNNGNKVNGIPGLNTRSVHTTVDMREGQWLAIAGLIQDQQEGARARLPFLGDLPLAGAMFGKNLVQRDETELLILVSPQLIHPLEDRAIPSILPGMEVSEPNNKEFFVNNRIEGKPQEDFRSTVWPNEVADVQRTSRSNKVQSQHRQSQRFYLQTKHGFSDDH